MSGKRSALIVATGQYKDGRLAPLDGPARDAEALRSVLLDKDIGGFDVKIALNSRVETLRRTLEAFFADRGRDDLLLVHFSGHGLKDDEGQLYFAAADTQIDRLLSTAIDASWVNRMMNRCRSERIALFLDCCFAGAFTSGMVRRAGVEAAGVNEHFGGTGVFVIAASDAMQYSFESGRRVGNVPEPSPFTGALVEGLRTGDADRDEDGFVSIDELFDYLEDRIRESSPSQTPTKSAFNQVGDWVIARSTRQPSIRLLPDDLQQQVKSDDTLDRFAALIALRDLAVGPDARVGEAARDALRRLADDDSRKVASAAQRLLEQLPERGRSNRGSRKGRIDEPASAVEPVRPTAGGVHVLEPPGAEAAQVAAEPERPGAPPPSTGHPPTPSSVSVAPTTAQPAQMAPAAALPVATSQPEALAFSPVTVARTPPLSMSSPAGSVGWRVGPAVTRVAIGTFLGVLLEYGWYLSANPWMLNDPSTLNPVTSDFGTAAVVLTVVATAVVVLAERVLPALRLPDGAFYRVVGGNRWAAAVLLGAIVGGIFGSMAEAAYTSTSSGQASSPGAEIIACTAVGFLLAEFLVSRWFASTGAAAAH